MRTIRKQEALDYHEKGRPGKIEVVPSKPYRTQRDLSLAYSPGVAEPCREIQANPEDVYRYTAKGNLVAVISNGTAVLGLGNIGPEASKPVMEGKGLLFKIFADIDVFDIEVNETDVDRFVDAVKAIAPTFGGINLEDIRAPDAFEIERRLKDELSIPVMHDDQHGTAIISAAALLNALEIAGKDIGEVRVVVSGAGASAISCVKLYLSLGIQKENVLLFDSKGPVTTDREDLGPHKRELANAPGPGDLAEALQGADVFLGLSRGNIVTPAMLAGMAENPIVFALANPDPEIAYEDAIAARDDIIMATGRSDHPNQVNNVLGFPYIFRGALDVRASAITEEMKRAAVHAIADLAKESVPEEVNEAYGARNLSFGPQMIIPKPLDPRLITAVAPAVAQAAMDAGLARRPIEDWDAYRNELVARLGLDNKFIKQIHQRAKQDPRRVVFAEADHYSILKAAQITLEEGIALPILLGNEAFIRGMIEADHLGMENCPIIDPQADSQAENVEAFAQLMYAKRQRRGVTLSDARKLMRRRNYFGAALLETGEADALISGLTRNYPDTIRPALQLIGVDQNVEKIAGMYALISKDGIYFFADTTVNLNPSAEELVGITLLVAKAVKRYRIEPRIAMLSYSNFGSSGGTDSEKVREAVRILHKSHPDLIADGEIQANFALNQDLLREHFPFSPLTDKPANTFIFPNLAAGNIAYKLIQEMSDTEAIGPILLGMKKPVHVLQTGSSVQEIVNMIAVAVLDAQKHG
jgi:malate dehydrogenase (oxaloacetate-decarboxylating)(NADP+)